MQIRNFIWDFDGTLVDTYPHTTAAFFDVMRPYGFDADRDEVMENLHESLSSGAKKYGLTQQQFQAFLERTEELWFEPAPTVYPGVEQGLRAIVAAGGKNFLFTHRNHTATDYLQAFGLLQFFTDGITCESAGFVSKPSGDSVRTLICRHGLDPDHTVMIGDREMDVLAGLNAGCHAILFDPDRRKHESAASGIVRDFSEFLTLL